MPTVTPQSIAATDLKTKTADLKTIAQGAGISFLGSLSFIGLSFLFGLLLARTMGAATLGIMVIALSITGIATTVSMFGFQRGVLRFGAFYEGQGDHARSAGAMIGGVRIIAVTSLVTAAIVYGTADLLATSLFNAPALGPVLRILAFSIPFSALMGILLSATQSLKRVEYRAIIEQMVVPFLKVVGLIIVVYAVVELTVGVAYAIVLASIVGAILAAISVWRLYPLRGQSRSPVMVTRAMLAFSWPLLLETIVIRTWRESQLLVLAAMTTSDQAGIFFVGMRAVVILGAFEIAFNTIFSPIIAELQSQDAHERLGSLVKTVTRWQFSLGLPVFLLLMALSKEVMQIFGPEYVVGAVILQIWAVTRFISLAVGPAEWLISMSGHPRLSLLNATLSLVLDLILALLLIPRFGIVGAAIGAALSRLLVNSLRLVQVYAFLGIHPYNAAFLKPIGAGSLSLIAAIGLSSLAADWPLAWRVGSFAFVLIFTYAAGLVVLQLDEDDRIIVQVVRSRLVFLGAQDG